MTDMLVEVMTKSREDMPMRPHAASVMVTYDGEKGVREGRSDDRGWLKEILRDLV